MANLTLAFKDPCGNYVHLGDTVAYSPDRNGRRPFGSGIVIKINPTRVSIKTTKYHYPVQRTHRNALKITPPKVNG